MSTATVDFFSGPSLDEIPTTNSFTRTIKTIENISAEITKCNNEIKKWETRKNKIKEGFKIRLKQVYDIVS
jgi:hypothetical protein